MKEFNFLIVKSKNSDLIEASEAVSSWLLISCKCSPCVIVVILVNSPLIGRCLLCYRSPVSMVEGDPCRCN